MAIYDTPEYDEYLEKQYLQIQENAEELERQLKTLEAEGNESSLFHHLKAIPYPQPTIIDIVSYDFKTYITLRYPDTPEYYGYETVVEYNPDSQYQAEGSGDICTVCGDTAVHFYKDGEVILCDKHYQQQYGKYSAEEASPVKGVLVAPAIAAIVGFLGGLRAAGFKFKRN